MDATELGLQVFYIILLPGFLFGKGFGVASRTGGKGTEFAALCYAALWGAILFTLISSDSDKLMQLSTYPLQSGMALSLAAFILGIIIGIPIGFLRKIFY